MTGSIIPSTERPLEIGPYQEPHPPLWRPGALRTAAQLGVSTILPGPISLIAKQADVYRQEINGRGAGGHTPLLSTLRRVVVAPTDQEAIAIGERAWARFDKNLTKLMHKYDLWPPTLVPSFLGDVEMAHSTESLIVGSPSRVSDYFDQFLEESGIQHVTISPAWGDISGHEAMRTMELFVEHVASN
jgi:alkanesulfonate monooxygenase SsuD/methylene tetrahydromethanopterin reductase-like flavin-dependent oxidoreductase (luciferase family)